MISKNLVQTALVATTLLAPGVGYAQTASDVCSTFAAHPDDPQKNPDFPGVSDADFDGAKAIDACIDAYTANPNDPATAFQLARSYIQIGDMEQGWSFLTYAAELGNPAAIHLYGKILEANGEVSKDELGLIYGSAKDAGFAPAQEDAKRYPAPEVEEAAPAAPTYGATLDFSRFSQPELVRAMIDGDIKTLKTFKSGVILEDLGISVGLLRYMSGFDSSISAQFFCPADLPAGVAEQITHYTTMTALSQLPLLLMDPQRLGDIFGPSIQNPTGLIKDLMALETVLKVTQRAGSRDAMILYETGCGSPELQAIGRTLEKLLVEIHH